MEKDLTNEKMSESLTSKQASKQAEIAWYRDMGVNKNGKDEWYTPREAVKIIIPFLRPGAKVLCPFDTEKSEFVKTLTECGFEVVYSHIDTGTDFFSLDKPNVDYVISNPPFSIRDAILKRLYEWRIPFAMIFNVNGLFDSRNRLTLAKRYGAETLFVYPRIKFIDGNGERNSPPFQSCYWCYNILPKGLMFEVMEENAEQMSLEDYIEG